MHPLLGRQHHPVTRFIGTQFIHRKIDLVHWDYFDGRSNLVDDLKDVCGRAGDVLTVGGQLSIFEQVIPVTGAVDSTNGAIGTSRALLSVTPRVRVRESRSTRSRKLESNKELLN